MHWNIIRHFRLSKIVLLNNCFILIILLPIFPFVKESNANIILNSNINKSTQSFADLSSNKAITNKDNEKDNFDRLFKGLFISAENPIINSRINRFDLIEKQAIAEKELEDKLRREFVRVLQYKNRENDNLFFQKKTYSKIFNINHYL